MKAFDRVAVLLLNLCLAAAAILLPALSLAASPAYYAREFERCGIYAEIGPHGEAVPTPIHYIGGDFRRTATFSDEQLDAIAAHIIDFLFGDTEDFSLTMDGVMLNGSETDGVAIFGEAAITHMRDVRELMRLSRIVASFAAALIPLLLIYLILRRRAAGKIALRYTLVFYAVVLVLAALFCYFALRGAGGDYADAFWRAAHRLFFPFSPDKVAGSFFNDALTSLLTLPLFMSAVYTVLVTFSLSLLLWLLLAIRLYRAAK